MSFESKVKKKKDFVLFKYFSFWVKMWQEMTGDEPLLTDLLKQTN